MTLMTIQTELTRHLKNENRKHQHRRYRKFVLPKDSRRQRQEGCVRSQKIAVQETVLRAVNGAWGWDLSSPSLECASVFRRVFRIQEIDRRCHVIATLEIRPRNVTTTNAVKEEPWAARPAHAARTARCVSMISSVIVSAYFILKALTKRLLRRLSYLFFRSNHS